MPAKMWVKICGTTTLQDTQLAVNAGADAVGFVCAESKRRVMPAQIAAITAALPAAVEKVGVFHTSAAADIITAAHEAGLSAVQIHSTYNPETVRQLRAELEPGTKLLQVIPCSVEGIDEGSFEQELLAALANRVLWGILLDASKAGVSGGTGRSFDWVRVAQLLDALWPDRHSTDGPKLILAGGLRPENVREAIAVLRPDGVDVVSGVERAPGTKAPDRVHAFIAAARS